MSAGREVLSAPSREQIAELFDTFPGGILVCERDGGVSAANGCARELLATAEAQAEVAELRITCSGAALHVRVASLDGRVVIELRPEGRSAGRCDPPLLRVYALGRLRVERDGQPLTGDWVDQRAGQLLRCLVCERHRIVPTEVLAEAIWRQAGPGAPNTVRHFIHTLRERLEPGRTRHGESAFVVSRRGGYALDRERVWIDVDAFEEDIAAGRTAAASGDDAAAHACLERAVAAYAGDFLADDPYAEWAMAERERLRGLLALALRTLAGLSRDDPEQACRYLERLALLEPFDNDTARELISAWISLGRRSRAVRFYQAFQLRMAREFGESPDFRIADVLTPGRGRFAAVG